MTGYNARRPRTGRERRMWWRLSQAFYLTVWTLNDRFVTSLVNCMVRRAFFEYWRKETENLKCFFGVVGLDGRCSVQAEQREKPVAVGPLPGAYLSTETNFVPICGVTRKEFDTGHTHTELKRRGPGGPRRAAHVTLGKSKTSELKRSASSLKKPNGKTSVFSKTILKNKKELKEKRSK